MSAHLLSCVRLFVFPWTVVQEAPLSTGSSQPEPMPNPNGLPFPPPEDLPISGIKPSSPASPTLQAESLLLSHRGNP